ncbi:MAG: diaminopimelate decarboxylase [Pirellulaceae bacterium]
MSTESSAVRLCRTEIAGVPIRELVERFGTPTYVYDESKILERVNDLRSFDVIRYAQKACSNIAILDLMRRQGVLVDAVSAGEIHRALAAGYEPGGQPPGIVYTADIFDHDSLRLVLEHDLHMNVGSPDMIEQLGEMAPGHNITLRINPGFGHGHSQKTNTGGEHSKHGIWHEQLEHCLRRADHHGLGVTGLHMHIGSGTDLEHLAQVCTAMEQAALTTGRSVISISAGGGLSIPYRPHETHVNLDGYFALWDAMRKRLEREFGHAVSVEIEPGRYLSAESGLLVAEIRAVKRTAGNLFYLLDAGFNNLARPILYGAYHPMAISPRDGDVQREVQDVVVGGPLCESGDIFTQEEGGFVSPRPLPIAAVGDWLVIECAGAYGFVMSSNYNSKPLAAEVLVRQGAAHLVRARQSYTDLMRGECIPD